MHWRTLDLNLLVVFDAVAQERSATRAAARLNMTQPALSHALTRLRRTLHDDLFVRTPDGMEPTPFAQVLQGPVRTALDGLQSALDGPSAFEPATTGRRFTIVVDNRSALVMAAPVAAAVAAEAPNLELEIRPSGTLDVPSGLDRGDLDLALGNLAAPGERFSDLRLYDDGFAAILRQGHPAAGPRVLSLGDLASYPHLVLSSTGENTDFVDGELARSSLARKIAFRCPLLAAPALLAASDLIAVMSLRGAQAFARASPLHVMGLPFSSPKLTTAMLWHRRLDDVPAHRWLRTLVLRVARAL